MHIVHTHCAGLDVHKRTVMVAIIIPGPDGQLIKKTRSFETITASLVELSNWLIEHSITHIAMGSNCEYWKPIYNILEENFEL